MPMVLSSNSWPVLRFHSPLRVASTAADEVLFEGEQQQERVFGDRGVIDAGGEEHGKAEFGGGFHVDLVDADAVFADDLQARARLLQHPAGDHVVAADEGIDVADEFEGLRLAQGAAGADDFPAGVSQDPVMLAGSVLKGRRGKQDAFHDGWRDK